MRSTVAEMDPLGPERSLSTMIRTHCSPEWREMIRQYCVTIDLEKGEALFREGDTAEHLFIVKRGKIKVFTTFKTGTLRILRFAADGQVVGHRGLGGDGTFTASATALVPSTVDRLPMKVFLNTLKSNPAFSFHLMLFLAEELRRSEEFTKAAAQQSVAQRVAKAIISTYRCFGFDRDDDSLLAFTPSRQELADHAGTTYESTIRALGELQRSGCIRTVGKDIRIVDVTALTSFTR